MATDEGPAQTDDGANTGADHSPAPDATEAAGSGAVEPRDDDTPEDLKKTLRRAPPAEIEQARAEYLARVGRASGTAVAAPTAAGEDGIDVEIDDDDDFDAEALEVEALEIEALEAEAERAAELHLPPLKAPQQRIGSPSKPPGPPPPVRPPLPATDGGGDGASRRPLPPPRAPRTDATPTPAMVEGAEPSPQEAPTLPRVPGAGPSSPPPAEQPSSEGPAAPWSDALSDDPPAGAPAADEPVAPAAADALEPRSGRRKRGSRRRQRRTLRIPADEVPAMPAAAAAVPHAPEAPPDDALEPSTTDRDAAALADGRPDVTEHQHDLASAQPIETPTAAPATVPSEAGPTAEPAAASSSAAAPIGPESVEPESVEPDTLEPEAIEPEATEPEPSTAEPDEARRLVAEPVAGPPHPPGPPPVPNRSAETSEAGPGRLLPEPLGVRTNLDEEAGAHAGDPPPADRPASPPATLGEGSVPVDTDGTSGAAAPSAVAEDEHGESVLDAETQELPAFDPAGADGVGAVTAVTAEPSEVAAAHDAAPAAAPSPPAATQVEAPAAAEAYEAGPDSVPSLEQLAASRRAGSSNAAGMVTDQASVGIIMPIQVSSDLPAVESKPKRQRPLPPRRKDRPESLEELEPDALAAEGSDPGLEPDSVEPAQAAAAAAPQAGVEVRRPPPPPRHKLRADGTPGDGDGNHGGEPAVAPTPSPPPAAAMASPPASANEAQAPDGSAWLEPLNPPAAAPAEPVAEVPAPAAPKPAPKRKKAWWIDLFDEDWLRTMDPTSRGDAEREVAFIERRLRLQAGSRVLDLGCGSGRHAVELAARGYHVVGVDMSAGMLSLAADYALERGQRVNLVKGDMRRLSLDAVFDGIFCWSSTFGYFDDQTNINVLESIHRALRPGGMFALDVTNRDFVAPRSPTMVWFEQPGCVCMDEMKFDFFTSRMVVKRMVLFETGRSKEIEYSIRLYGLHELGRLLHQVGFKVLEVSGHRAHPGAYFGSESPRTIIAAERL